MPRSRDIAHLAAGARGRERVLANGDMEDGVWWAGQSQGLIHEVLSAREVVESVVAEAEDVIVNQLAGQVKVAV